MAAKEDKPIDPLKGAKTIYKHPWIEVDERTVINYTLQLHDMNWRVSRMVGRILRHLGDRVAEIVIVTQGSGGVVTVRCNNMLGTMDAGQMKREAEALGFVLGNF